MKQFIKIILIGSFIMLAIACNRQIIKTMEYPGLARGYDTTQYNLLYTDAIRQKMLGNSGDALKYFEQALSLNPGSDASAFQISQIAAIKGDFASAKKYAIKAYNLDPQNSWYILNVANHYYNDQKLDSVANYYEKLLLLEPGREDIKFNLGSIYNEIKEYEKAEKIFSEFTREYGENPQILVALVEVYRNQEKFDEAEEYLLKIIEIEPENTSYLGLLAEYYRSVGREDDALDVYRLLFEKDPGNGVLQLSYMDFLLAEAKYDELAEFLTTVVNNDDVSFEGKINIFGRLLNDSALISNKAEELELAAMTFKARNDEDPTVTLILAELYSKSGRPEKEITLLEEHLKKDESNYFVWEKLILALNESGKNEELFERSARASTLFNRAPLPKLLYAFAATDREDYVLALSELKKVRILVNEQAEYMLQILSLEADVYYRQRDFDKAFSSFDQALNIDPADQLILNNYAYFLAEQNLDLKKALNMIEQCLKIESNPTYLDTYAWVLFKNRKYRKAEEVMDSLSNSGLINDPELYEHYGFIKYSRGKCSEAVANWKIALDMDASKSYLNEEISKCQKTKQ